MQLVPFESVECRERRNARDGKFLYWQLLEGTEGSAANFSLQLVKLTNYYSPRHRHSFEQIRLQLDGTLGYDRDGKMGPESIAYFPEGVRYGPQTADTPESTLLVLQFAGASGLGYMSERVYNDAVQQMKALGEFSGGVFTRHVDGRKVNQDAYEAVWEHVNGRPLEYPKPRYNAPVFFMPDAFEWQPLTGCTGAREKHLGTFTERRVSIRLLQIDPQAQAQVQGPALAFAMSGSGTVQGQQWTQQSTLRIEAGEAASIRSDALCQWLCIGVPLE